MTGLFLFCLAVGAPLLVWFVVSGGDGDGGEGPLGPIPLSSVAFVLAFFGGAGLVAGAVGASGAAALVLAVVVALVAGALNTAAFAYLRRSSSSSDVTDAELEGRIATASLPMTTGTRGRIVLEVAGTRAQMTATPADDTPISTGDRVVVVGVERGVALVARLDPELGGP
jgi:membrane protein implicated in regulation of membrane protease activity